MYEIWLALNIVWETVLGAWPWLLAITIVWLALLTRAGRRGSDWAAGLRSIAGLGAAVAILSFLLIPWLTASSLGELSYWVDVVTLAAISLGFGALAALLAWPLAAPQKMPNRR